ncbi:SpoIIE family protein phosphatase [Kitasatospora sp. NPDC052896]|uniref:SpoIIE family protein phosphatase n=1 Tax=Kitasatospora sp. NPDC052896 TaxID=3364061 RepID=UPI0037CC98F1
MTAEPTGTEPPEATIDRMRSEITGLRQAMRTRAVIEQAKGLLVARLRCTPEQAFDWLVRRSQDSNRKLVDLAAELLGRAAPPTGADDAGAPVAARAPANAPAPDAAPPPVPPTAPRRPAPAALTTELARKYHLAAAALGAARTPDELARALHEVGLAPLAAGAVALTVLEPDGALRLVGSHGVPTHQLSQWQRIPPHTAVPSVRAARGGSPVWAEQAADPGHATSTVPGRSVCALPLEIGGRTIGSLAVGWPEQRGPDRATTRYLAALARLCAGELPRVLPDRAGESPGEPWFRAVLDALLDPVLILESVRALDGGPVDLRVRHANAATVDLAGRTAADLVGGRFTELYPGLVAAGVLARLLAVVTGGEPYQEQVEPFVELVGGAPRAASLTLRATPFLDGVLVSWRAHDELARRKTQLEQAQRLAGLGTWHWQSGSTEIVCSAECCRLFGREAVGAVGVVETVGVVDAADAVDRLPVAAVEAAVLPADLPAVHGSTARLLAGESPATLEFRIRRPDDSVRALRVMAEAVGAGERAVVAVRGVVQDVTAWRRTERALSSTRVQLAEQRRQTVVEHRTVRSLQHALLDAPRGPAVAGLEVAARYLPAEREAHVGGDWYDALTLPDGSVLIVVGDVSGHGLPAAAGMAQLRYALRGLAFTGVGPEVLLGRLNRMLFHQGSDYIATVVCGRLDPATRVFGWARAGHPPPVLLRAGAARLPEVPAGIVLGAVPNARYTRAELPLTSGEAVLLYTDGLVERPGEDPDSGLDRLLRAAEEYRAAGLEGCLDHVLRRLGAPNPRDDTCLLGFRLG